MVKRFLTLLCILAFALPALAGTMPRTPRLASSPGGLLLGGFQSVPGADGTFDLFTTHQTGGIAGLGRFNGKLGGVAIGKYDNHFYGLTRDGALTRYGYELETIVYSDSRWTFIALGWHESGLAALGYTAGGLYIVKPNLTEQTWQDDAELVVETTNILTAVLVPLDTQLHLLWANASADLSSGAIRHRVLENGEWRELAPLPVGETASFAVYRHGDGLALTALVQPPLGLDQPPTLISKVWFDSEWTDDTPLQPETSARLLAASEFAATWSDNHTHWLTTGISGAYFSSPHAQAAGDGMLQPSAQPGVVRLDAGPGADELPWPELTSLLFLIVLIGLIILSCRRSRMLARLFPGRAPDLTTRAVALTIDWLLISIALSVYHIVAGDMRIYQELLTFGEVNQMFWMNLGALALFMIVCEAWFGQTPGKWLTGLRVRSILGGPPVFLQVILRNVARIIDMFPVIFPGAIGAISAMFNPRRQRVGDVLAGTIVRRHYPIERRRFILASASPRRLELLNALGLDVKQVPSHIDEERIEGDTPEGTARLLAEAKAQAVAETLHAPGEILIAADTLVVLDDTILGKPANAEEAKHMLQQLSGRSHLVVTGISVWDSVTGQGLSDVETTEVEFRKLSEREIDAYIATGDPLDKAGAYGVQTGNLVKEVRGSLSNVAGLPMEMLQSMLTMLDS